MQINRNLFQEQSIHILLIVVIGLAVYSNTFLVPFIFDDYGCIRDNPAIQSFHFFKDTRQVFELDINPDIKNNFILRPLTYFTFAINYHLHGFKVFGYHLVNLILHLGSSLLVYCLFRITLNTQIISVTNKYNYVVNHDYVRYLPLIASLLFVCHPLQTQAVTYIVQRFVPLATLFYLSSLVLYVQFRRTTTLKLCLPIYLFSLFAAVLAMESKEIAFTLPVIICLYECIFLSGKIAIRFAGLIPFLLTMAIIPVKLFKLSAPSLPNKASQISQGINLVNFSDVTSHDYLITQFGVITTYIRLLLLPIGQKYFYVCPLHNNIFTKDVLLPLALLIIIIGTGIYLLIRSKQNWLYKIIAFGIFWFFITLTVESSIIPIVDMVVEHRVYLPSVGFFMALSAFAMVIFDKINMEMAKKSKYALFLFVAILFSLSATTLVRNYVWRDKIRFWQDAVNKTPELWQPAFNLSAAYIEANRLEEGAIALIKSIERNPDSFELNSYFELKKISTLLGRSEIAFEIINAKKGSLFDGFKNEILANPGSAHPRYKLGMIYLELYRLDEAVDEFHKALAIRSDKYEVYLGLTKAYIAQGKIDLADKTLEGAEKLSPKNLEILKLRRIIDDWQSSSISEF